MIPRTTIAAFLMIVGLVLSFGFNLTGLGVVFAAMGFAIALYNYAKYQYFTAP